MGGSPSPYGRSTAEKRAANTKWIGNQVNTRTNQDVTKKSSCHCREANLQYLFRNKTLEDKITPRLPPEYVLSRHL
jgi:hypothetical protein